jgi:hypothetical protein
VLGLGSPNRLSHRIAAGHPEQRRNFVGGDSIRRAPSSAYSHTAVPDCANAVLLEPLKSGLKVLTHALKDLLGSDSLTSFSSVRNSWAASAL